jgi:hypothetical protein
MAPQLFLKTRLLEKSKSQQLITWLETLRWADQSSGQPLWELGNNAPQDAQVLQIVLVLLWMAVPHLAKSNRPLLGPA